jgi:hypothetical protein
MSRELGMRSEVLLTLAIDTLLQNINRDLLDRYLYYLRNNF